MFPWFSKLKLMLDVYFRFTKAINSVVMSKGFKDHQKVFQMRMLLMDFEICLKDANETFNEMFVFSEEQNHITKKVNAIGLEFEYSLN